MAVSVTPSSRLNSVETLHIDSSSQLLFTADVYGEYWHTLEIQHMGKVIVNTSPFELNVGVSATYAYELSKNEITTILSVMHNFKTIDVSIALRSYSSKSADNLVGLPSVVRSVIGTSSNVSAPTIEGFSYIDASAETVSVTGNNQVIIQGVSNLQITIEGASAHNGAEILGYRVTCKGKTMFFASSVVDFGKIDCSGDVTLFVTVVDSRGYSTTVQKNVSVIEYNPPEISFSLYRNESNSVLVMADVSVSISPAGGYNSFVSLEKRDKNLKDDSWSDWKVFSSTSSFSGQLYYYTDSDTGEIEIRALDVFSTSKLISGKVYPTYPNVEVEKGYINVIGSLMLNHYGVMGYKGVVTSGFNDYKTSGFYAFDGTNRTDCPETTEGILEVIGIYNYVMQRLYCISGNTYWRMCVAEDTWTDWFS